MPTYLITGSSRGIGLEFVRQLARHDADLIAAVRDPAKAERALKAAAPKVTIVELDVSDARSIDALPSRLSHRPIDVLINNAGVHSTAKTLKEIDAAEFARVFMVNAYAPILVTKALLPNLRAGSRRLIIQITSILASIAGNTGGSSYAYRASKTALNQLNKSLSIELAPDRISAVAIHPGWVKTDMGGPDAHLTVQDSVSSMLSTIDKLGTADSGKFLNYDGTPLPW